MKVAKFIFACISLVFMHNLYALQTQAPQDSPIGFWKTIDDVTGQPKAIVQIQEAPNKLLLGRIVKIYPEPGDDQNEMCTACDGERHNQRILGMTILENLKRDKDTATQWVDGKILDPKTGKIYLSNIRLIEKGQKLNVRGYIGLPLFGRSQTWLRVANPIG